LQRPAVRGGRVRWFVGPLSGWGSSRELPGLPRETFREWWERRDRA
jgi:L-lactate dehydrogenase complex protein LldF